MRQHALGAAATKFRKEPGNFRDVVVRNDIECDNVEKNRTNGPFRISVRTGMHPGIGIVLVQAIPASLPATVKLSPFPRVVIDTARGQQHRAVSLFPAFFGNGSLELGSCSSFVLWPLAPVLPASPPSVPIARSPFRCRIAESAGRIHWGSRGRITTKTIDTRLCPAPSIS